MQKKIKIIFRFHQTKAGICFAIMDREQRKDNCLAKSRLRYVIEIGRQRR